MPPTTIIAVAVPEEKIKETDDAADSSFPLKSERENFSCIKKLLSKPLMAAIGPPFPPPLITVNPKLKICHEKIMQKIDKIDFHTICIGFSASIPMGSPNVLKSCHDMMIITKPTPKPCITEKEVRIASAGKREKKVDKSFPNASINKCAINSITSTARPTMLSISQLNISLF